MRLFSKMFRRDDTLGAGGTIEEVAIFRSSGTLETGWRVDGVLDNTVWVSADGLCKRVPMADVLRANPALLIGRTLRIQGSSGKFEGNWQAAAFFRGDEHVKLEKPGRAETVSIEQIAEWNDWGSEFRHAA